MKTRLIFYVCSREQFYRNQKVKRLSIIKDMQLIYAHPLHKLIPIFFYITDSSAEKNTEDSINTGKMIFDGEIMKQQNQILYLV